jgi:hypothetical protein
VTRKIADVWPIQPDGLVEGVEITTELDETGVPAGFTTTVRIGARPREAAPQRTRPRRQVEPDALTREGLR